MRILVIGSKVQQMSGLAHGLVRLGYDAAFYPKPTEDLEGSEEEEKALEDFLKNQKVDFVLSNIFGSSAARATNRLNIKYAVWCMDSPAYFSYVPEVVLDNCFLFYFDRHEYELRKQEGLTNVYHLPLATDITWSSGLVITDEEIKKYRCDMSFVGTLYSHNLYDQLLERFPADIQNIFTDMIENSAFVWDGEDRLHIPRELATGVRKLFPDLFDGLYISDEYYLKTFLMGRKLSHVERTLLMELLSQRYGIHLYTRAADEVPEGVRRFPEVGAVTEALKVFYSSKINLNITLRSIVSGVPARVFDVMSVGGFMMSNWQEEIPELFVEDKEIVTYKTPEELVDKADYYLKHEDKRTRIAINGYRRVKEQHTYEHRLNKIISIVQGKA
ncbi:MAG: glycosyltransferase [Lachnospiraceae bacterium]|nr:glycosyltransferase [Lachnospiraceae bacterium]